MGKKQANQCMELTIPTLRRAPLARRSACFRSSQQIGTFGAPSGRRFAAAKSLVRSADHKTGTEQSESFHQR